MPPLSEYYYQEPVQSVSVSKMQIGWYQDQKAELYYYEGENHWRYVDLETNKKLTEAVIAGSLEYIG
jgi:bacillopeptidase F (M6 metalloprotease family)